MPPQNPTYDSNGINFEALTWALKALAEKSWDYQKARNYYSGNHPLDFVTDKFRSAFAQNLSTMRANLCPTVIDVPANRLIVSGFGARLLDKKESRPFVDAARDVWETNRMDTRASDSMKEAFKCGDSYIIVWPDVDASGKRTPILYPQLAGACAVQYHPERPGFIIRAAKWWLENQKIRINIYTAQGIEKYVTTDQTPLASTGPLVPVSNTPSAYLPVPLPSYQSATPSWFLPASASSFVRYTATNGSGQEEAWPLPNLYGKCPVFHFPNGQDRKSELCDIYDPQNAYNLTICNLLVSMEFFAYPQRYVTGYDPRTQDPDGSGIAQWKAAFDRIWFHGDHDAKFGQFTPSSPTPYLEVMREFRTMIAEIAGIPPHYFSMSGHVPSGVALQILEKRMSDKVSQRQAAWGNVWADLMLLALKMRGDIPGEANIRLSTEWRDTSTRDDLAEAQAQQVKQDIGVSQRQSLREMGYSDERIDEMQVESQGEKQSAGTLLGAAFNAGNV